MSDGTLNIIFLLGAGASMPAGLPDMKRLTDDFLNSATQEKFDSNILPKINTIKAAAFDFFRERNDLESMMTIIKRMEDVTEITILTTKYPDLKSITLEELKIITNLIENFIRNKLEAINKDSIKYLEPILGFLSRGTIEIFTLNYDGILDLLLESNNIEYSDGFSPFWNPTIFENPSLKVKLYRLHGSLYWFSIANGKNIKLPVKGLRPDQMSYITNDALSEMILYPRMQKEKHSQIYSWLSHRFIERLKESDIFIIIGYSFRDQEIVDNIVEILNGNPRLWILILSPRASEHKKSNFANNIDLSSRVAPIDMGITEASGAARLYTYVQKLEKSIIMEREMWIKQHQNKDLYGQWNELIGTYLYLGLQERINYVCSRLKSSYGFTEEIIDELLTTSKNQVKLRWPSDM